MVFLRNRGVHPSSSHGGGLQISAMLKRLNIQANSGRLPGDPPEVLDVARMVLFGQVGRNWST